MPAIDRRPYETGEFLSVREIAERVGVSIHRVYRYTISDSWPRPDYSIGRAFMYPAKEALEAARLLGRTSVDGHSTIQELATEAELPQNSVRSWLKFAGIRGRRFELSGNGNSRGLRFPTESTLSVLRQIVARKEAVIAERKKARNARKNAKKKVARTAPRQRSAISQAIRDCMWNSACR